MKRTIELKHVEAKGHVRRLIEELISRLEDKLRHFRQDAVSVHVLFEENGNRSLYRTSLSCHIPRHMIAAHEENRQPGVAIRRAFAEVERQLEKQTARFYRAQQRKRALRAPQPEASEF